MPRISQKKLDREVRTALRNSGLPDEARACTVGLWSAQDEARAEERDYAWVVLEELEFGFSRKILVLDDDHRRAIVAHEVGHVLAWTHYGDDSEDGADHAAEQFLGVPICYDHDWPGKGLQVDCRIANPKRGRMKNPKQLPEWETRGSRRAAREQRSFESMTRNWDPGDWEMFRYYQEAGYSSEESYRLVERDRTYAKEGGEKSVNSGPRNPYQGDAVELAKYRKARERWEREGRRGPPPMKPRSRNPKQKNPAPIDVRALSMARRLQNP